MKKTYHIRKSRVAGRLLLAGAFAAGLAYGTCPNEQADHRSQPSCRTCSTWTSNDEGKSCSYSDTFGANIYGSCWDDNAKGHKAVLINPPVLLNGELWNRTGTCASGVCTNTQPYNVTQYSANEMTTKVCSTEE